jgi:hypothetical protein
MSPEESEPVPRGKTLAGASPTRRIIMPIIAVIGGVVLAIAICEALLWIIAPMPYHEWLVWEAEGHIRARPEPNQLIKTAAGYEVHINKYGFRGPDYEYEKKPGTLRIAVFGGSSTFGFNASGEEKTWPGALEFKLKRRLGMPVEVINLGLPGFSSFNSKINYLCFGRAFQPDAIIVYHTWNDIARFRDQEVRPYKSFGSRPPRPFWHHIARATQLGRRGRQFLWMLMKRRLEPAYKAEEGTGVRADRPVVPRAFAWERKNFEDFVNLAKSDGVLPILVSQASLASPESITDPDVRMAIIGGGKTANMTIPLIMNTWSKISAIIQDVARQGDAIFVDGYDAVPHSLEYMADLVHLHDAGNELLAETIANVLLDDPRFRQLVDRVAAEKQ